MKTKVKIDEITAKKLINAGVPVEIHYYMHVEAVEEPAAQITIKEPEVPGFKGKIKKRATPLVARAPAGCFFTLGQKKQKLNDLLNQLTPALRTYMASIIFFLSQEASDGKATRTELAAMLVDKHPRLKAGSNPIGTAKTYVSRAYQIGIIEEKQ